MYKWLEQVLSEQYQFVKRIRSTEKNEIIVLAHKTLHRRIIKRVFTGKSEVYQNLLTIKHKNMPEILEVTESEGKTIVLEEYIDGTLLCELLEEELYTEKSVKLLVSEICDVLSLLHAHKIVHRDIKPENIMIDNCQNVRLIDFDSARIYKPYIPRDTEYLGTVGYAAPEQYDDTATDTRADVFALGVLMNVMLTGKSPSAQLYHGKLRKIIEKCIHVSPDKRFQTVEELKRSLK